MKHSRRVRSRRRGSVAFAGIVVRSLAFLTLIAGFVAVTRWISQEGVRNVELLLPSSHSVARDISVLAGPQPAGIQARNRRLVYPYSIVPGGVASAAELREATDHDPVVAEHYQGFDYGRARMVEVKEPRLVYLSYRRNGKVHWTHKQASLHKGEKLLTDGKITARTRCGNQVSVLPQADTLLEEPTMAELDRPDAVASGMESLPSNFDSSLLSLDPELPTGPSSPGSGLGGGTRCSNQQRLRSNGSQALPESTTTSSSATSAASAASRCTRAGNRRACRLRCRCHVGSRSQI